MSKNIVATKGAPGAIGPYNQAIKTDSMVFVSGQIPINPETGEIPEGIAAQTKQSLNNIKNILEAAGSSMDKVVKTSIFLKNMDDFSVVNEAYAEAFAGTEFPARSCVAVAKLPKDVNLEIEAIAVL